MRIRALLLSVVSVGVISCTFAGWLFEKQRAGSRDSKVKSNLAARREYSVLAHPSRFHVRSGTVDGTLLSSVKSAIELPADRKHTASAWLHLVRVFGLDMAQTFHGRHLKARDLFLNAEVGADYFGEPLFRRTRHGIRFGATGARVDEFVVEVHRDQVLSVLAEMGLGRSHNLELGDAPDITLDSALQDSIANFHPEQNELVWTAKAYLQLLPPERQWVNKFDDTYDFDQLALMLIGQSPEGQSCAGVHLLEVLNRMLLVDQQTGIFRRERSYAGVKRRLDSLVSNLRARQSSDGSWSADWYKVNDSGFTFARGEAQSLEKRVLVTGHVLEFLAELSADIEFEQRRFQGAADWLSRTISDTAVREMNTCPASHAVRSLSLIQRIQGVRASN